MEQGGGPAGAQDPADSRGLQWLALCHRRQEQQQGEGGFQMDKQSFDMDYRIRVSQSLWDVVVAFNQ